MLLASTAEGEHALPDVEGLIEYIEDHPGRNTELLQQATVMMMELYRNQQTVVYDPQSSTRGYIEQLITEDPAASEPTECGWLNCADAMIWILFERTQNNH